ncbi:MAG: hypothetical protein ACRDT6_01105 [Micromonosporaceae bacterium]
MTGWVGVADPYLLRGLLRCVRCRRPMVAALAVGRRAYHCGPGCQQVAIDAAAAEADLLLGALIRCAVTLHADLRVARKNLPVTAEELRRWQRCDITDRRAVLLSAYTEVAVNLEGKLRPVWRQRG